MRSVLGLVLGIVLLGLLDRCARSDAEFLPRTPLFYHVAEH
jgi:hypothetical protein